MSNLSSLWLNDTAVTDTGLESLKGLTNLTDLTLKNTRVTDGGLNELVRAMPQLLLPIEK
jgi:hypothetical protein